MSESKLEHLTGFVINLPKNQTLQNNDKTLLTDLLKRYNSEIKREDDSKIVIETPKFQSKLDYDSFCKILQLEFLHNSQIGIKYYLISDNWNLIFFRRRALVLDSQKNIEKFGEIYFNVLEIFEEDGCRIIRDYSSQNDIVFGFEENSSPVYSLDNLTPYFDGDVRKVNSVLTICDFYHQRFISTIFR